MLRTIAIGSCVSVQGILVEEAPDGKMTIRLGEKSFVGYPVGSNRKA